MILYFLVQIISFKKYVYVLLGNNFFTVFRGGPLVLEAPGQLPSLPLFPEIRPWVCKPQSGQFSLQQFPVERDRKCVLAKGS